MATPSDPRTPVTSMFTDRLGRAGIRSGQVLLVLLLATALVIALVRLKIVVIPVLIALILAAALAPVVRFLAKRGMPRLLATWLTLLAGVVLLSLVVVLVVLQIEGQWDTVVKSASDGIGQLQSYLGELNLPIDSKQLDDFRQTATGYLTSSDFASSAFGGVTAVAEVLTSAFLLIVVLFFFLKDGPSIWEFLLTPFGSDHTERGRRIGRTAVRVLGGYVRGTVIVALVDAVLIGVALAIIGVPLALPLAVIVFITAFIPIVGATLAGAVAALVALVTNGVGGAIAVVIVVIVVNQLEGNLLQPVVMGQSLKLHPLVILIALTAGSVLGGIVGAILSVPIAAVAWAIVKVWDRPEHEPAPRKKAARQKQASA